jgi:hypothetical protein
VFSYILQVWIFVLCIVTITSAFPTADTPNLNENVAQPHYGDGAAVGGVGAGDGEGEIGSRHWGG